MTLNIILIFLRKKYGDNTGYVGNVAEVVDEESKRSLICDADCQQNTYADTQFAEDYIENKNNDDEETMITDAGFESEKNRQKAKEKNINLVSTDLKGKVPDQAIADFKTEDGVVNECPKGYTPIRSTRVKTVRSAPLSIRTNVRTALSGTSAKQRFIRKLPLLF